MSDGLKGAPDHHTAPAKTSVSFIGITHGQEVCVRFDAEKGGQVLDDISKIRFALVSRFKVQVMSQGLGNCLSASELHDWADEMVCLVVCHGIFYVSSPPSHRF